MFASRCRWLAVLLLVVVPAAVAAEGSAESSDASQSDEETPEWARKLYGDPPEFKVFEVGGHRFRVPYKYSRQSSEKDPFFQMSVLWPTLDPYWTDKPQPRDREDFDTLQVTVKPLERYALRQSNIWGHIAEVESALERNHKTVEKRAGLVRVEDGHFWVTWRPMQLGNMEQVVQIPCDPDAPEDRVGNCRVTYMPIEGVCVQIKFDRALFDNWKVIVNRIDEMLMKFRENQ